MRTLRWTGIGLGLVALLVWADHEAARRWPPHHSLRREVRASAAMLSTLSFGMRPLVADYLWIDAVQYFGHTLGHHVHDIVDGHLVERGLTGEDVAIASEVFFKLVRRILDVDPLFVRAPLLGAMFLLDPHAHPRLGLELLAVASTKNPRSWQIRLWHGFYRYALLGDREGALAELAKASSCPGSPDYVGGVRTFLATAPDSVTARVFFTRARQEARTETERRIIDERLEELEAGLTSFGTVRPHEEGHDDHAVE